MAIPRLRIGPAEREDADDCLSTSIECRHNRLAGALLMDGSALPNLLEADRLNPEYRRAILRARRDGVQPADPLATSLARARQDALAWHGYWQDPLPRLHRIIEQRIPGPVGPVPLRILYPGRRKASPLAVYFHGGGFALNSLTTHERLLRDLAVRARMPVCGVGYSLAPEHRFPVQVEEALAAVRWIVQHAGELGIARDRIAFIGDSAGANLALATACALRDSGEAAPAFLALLYGMFSDDLDTPSHRTFGSGGFGLTTARMRWFWEQYVPDPADRRDPRAAPLHADLSGLPPTLLIGAGLDCLLDDTLRLAERLRLAGTQHVLSVYADLPHGFATLASAVSRADDAVSEAADALRYLYRPSGAGWAERHIRQQTAHRRLAEAFSGMSSRSPSLTASRCLEGHAGEANSQTHAPLLPTQPAAAHQNAIQSTRAGR